MLPGIIAAGIRRTAAGEVDPSFGSLVSLCHFDGDYADVVSGRSWATVGNNVGIETGIRRFGSGSLSMTGSGGLRSNVAAGTHFGDLDYTVEMWVRPAIVSGVRQLYDGRHSGTTPGVGLSIYVTSSTLMAQAASTNPVGTLAVGQWHHIAASRRSGVLRTFINGVLGDEQADTRTYTAGQRIDLGQTYTNVQSFSGQIDDFRVTRGLGRYLENFTPPAAAFPNRGP